VESFWVLFQCDLITNKRGEEQMIKSLVILVSFFIFISPVLSIDNDVILEPFTYHENFETRELQAWASYPLWQDTAYDPNFRVNTIVPGDSNISVVQKVTPYTHVDNYAGAQKKLDMYMIPGSTINLRYYLKTHLPVEFFKVRLAAGSDGKVDFTITNPATNHWVWITVAYEDFLKENPHLMGRNRIKVNALAVLAKIPAADPFMPIYLGLDDITFKGVRAAHFQFTTPKIYKLSEWMPYIPAKHYYQGETFTLEGSWKLNANRVSLDINSFTNPSDNVFSTNLMKSGNQWKKSFNLSFLEGLYLATLKAYNSNKELSETQFTIYIAPNNIGGSHPRLWFNDQKLEWIKKRLNSERFKTVREDILNNAKEAREKHPVASIVFEMDQLPDDEELIGNVFRSVYPWYAQIRPWRDGVSYNALAYGLLDDKQAGEYAKQLMLKVSEFPFWVHPWFQKRGRHIYYPVGEFGMDMALGYDLVYDLMSEKERKIVRDALMKNIITACHRGYVEDNLVTCHSSNWVAHITGGSLMSLAAIYGDDAELGCLEPYFSGAMMKDYSLVQNSIGNDGGYGEGYGYYNFTMQSWSKSLPAIENVFKIDMSQKIHRSYDELIWAGLVQAKENFYFGDSQGHLNPLTNWAWLLSKYKDPLLGWFYNFLKEDETIMDVLYETSDTPRKNPFNENPNRLFKDVGTTVFKSGWDKDDFVFVMRTGAFYNHQHLDQGTFWMADRGKVIIGERHGSTYYDDPFYQSHYTQPIAHSTILIDGNHQSQRVGDPLNFAEGFHDHAFIYHFLDGTEVAFSSGDIGKLYWSKVKLLRRNVLYLKPRTLLMLDLIVPAEKDVKVTLLYQTEHLKDIKLDLDQSSIINGKNILHIKHIYPANIDVKAVETPHYIQTLKDTSPLVKEGMLTLTASTQGNPLVFANLLNTTPEGEADISYKKGDGFIAGSVNAKFFAFSTNPQNIYKFENISTDALAITPDDSKIFAAISTSLTRDNQLLIKSEQPITFEISKNSLLYYLAKSANVSIGVESEPERIILNGKTTENFRYDERSKCIILNLAAGEGEVSF
jgi:hypothetical protein